MARIPTPGTLSQQQRRFCSEYTLDLNATKAAVRSGYSAKSAASQAADLLKLPKVSEEIGRLEAKRISAADVSADATLRELQRLAMYDCRRLFEGGRFKPPDTWTDDEAAGVAAVDVTKRTNEDGSVEYTYRLRFHDKLRALEVLTRHLGLAREDYGSGVVVVVGSGDVNGTAIPNVQLHNGYMPPHTPRLGP